MARFILYSLPRRPEDRKYYFPYRTTPGRLSGVDQMSFAFIEVSERIPGSHSVTLYTGGTTFIRGEATFEAGCFADCLIKVFPADFRPGVWPTYVRPNPRTSRQAANTQVYDFEGTIMCAHRIHG